MSFSEAETYIPVKREGHPTHLIQRIQVCLRFTLKASNKKLFQYFKMFESLFLIKIQSHKYSRSFCGKINKYERFHFEVQGGGHRGMFSLSVIYLLEKPLMPQTVRLYSMQAMKTDRLHVAELGFAQEARTSYGTRLLSSL